MDDLISRQAVIQMFNSADRYVADSLRLCDTDKQFPQNEVFIVDDMYEGIEQLPSAQHEITEDDVKEWANKRYLAIIDGALYAEMQRRWSESEQRKGKWIDITKHGGDFLWKCSECGELELNDTDFCPNCGADMRQDDTSHPLADDDSIYG